MGEWKLTAGQLQIVFLTSKFGNLGVKFNSAKGKGHLEVYAPGESDKKIPIYNPKNPQKAFYETRYRDGDKYYRVDEIERKWFDRERPTVYITEAEMKKKYPLAKDGKIVSKQPLAKLNLSNVAASNGYFLLPKKEYANIQKYQKLIEYLGDDFALTSPMRLRIGSTAEHRYAIFVDKARQAVVAVEVLVKTGRQPEPEV
jgi:hypothetical protein